MIHIAQDVAILGLKVKSVQELHICGFEDIDSSPYDLFYTLALGKAMTELTSLTKLHLENQHEKVEEFDEFDDGMSSRIAHPPVSPALPTRPEPFLHLI